MFHQRKTSELKKRKILRRVLQVIVGLILLLLLALFIMSPGKIDPFETEDGQALPNSVSEISYQMIGGMEQGMIIRGESDQNPVLLFLHGGPGTTEYVPSKNSTLNLEKNFTVCYWEQRGAGKSYAKADPEDITVDQLIADTIEVTNYLRERFGQEKIYLMGHSWGTFLGMQAAAQQPDLYQAYIGTGQMKHAIEGERLMIDSMIEAADEARRNDLIEDLKRSSVYTDNQVSDSYFITKEKVRTELALIPEVVETTTLKEDFLQLLTCKEYTLPEKFYYIRGSMISGKSQGLFMEFTQRDLAEEVPKLAIPVYFLQGIYDDQTPYALAKDYFDELETPLKNFYTFEKSGHNPLFEESGKFSAIVDDIINETQE
ncbi:alpha/beta hydrolase [Enterococcus sp. 669A]|uniref:prolyl aminopeptidase n=1 Tax=Candidatus Enterococcus moelleringii TaxID=2815325 RepID=A0ABS3LB30_9ENTE|nr:alpha/beta hydrolase [Enterococcus sp. 669A]MBO1306848.1 alpha/beta hydrolase [Enterococcus sp. 669A]